MYNTIGYRGSVMHGTIFPTPKHYKFMYRGSVSMKIS